MHVYCRFDRFQSFVRAREAGLRATFDALDADGDGALDAAELAAALETVRVRCPDTRRVYHCRRKVSCVKQRPNVMRERFCAAPTPAACTTAAVK